MFDRQLDGGFQESQLIARVVALADVVKAVDLLILEQCLDRVGQAALRHRCPASAARSSRRSVASKYSAR